MGPMIQAESLRKTYVLARKSLPVLEGATLEVGEGELVAIVGRSGAGKSTLLHILGGLDRPDDGTVIFGGEDLYALSAGRRTRLRASSIGFVFQSYHLLPEMDVTENVMLPAMARGRESRARPWRRRATELLEAVGLGDRARHTPVELSGGEQQRVALARALMNNPQLVLADEPTGNLDDTTGAQVLDYLFRLIRGSKHTLILVTHNEKIAQSCDRVLVLRRGILEDAAGVEPMGAASPAGS